MAIEPPKFKVAKELTREDIFLSLASVPDSQRVFLGSSDGNVYALDCSAEKFAPVAMPGHTSYVTGLALAGEQLVSGSYDGQLIWWNPTTRELVRKIKAHDKWIRDVKSSPDGKLIASVGDDMVCRRALDNACLSFVAKTYGTIEFVLYWERAVKYTQSYL